MSYTTSAYIHLPFCKSKCNYCSFVSGTNIDKKKGYLYSLLKEIDYYYQGEELKTLYLGGGTPSLFEIDELSKIINKFQTKNDTEITIELNPNDVDYEYAKGLKSLGINRISMGAQSFNDNILKLIGRRHNSTEIYNAVETIKQAGFSNISLDLIYGLPTQTLEGFRYDLKEIISLGVQHLSLYGLKIETGCYFYNHPPKELPDDDLQADMYLLAGDITSQNGFNHYEISNYSKIGYSSRHNTNYWKCGEYYGFGLSAHGYLDKIRYSNVCDIEQYMSNPTEREYGKFLTKEEALQERIFLGLRLSEGVNISQINNDFEIDFNKKYEPVLNKYLQTGHLTKTDVGYRLSDNKETNGFLLSNIILSDFI